MTATWAHRGAADPGFSGMLDARERVTGRVPYVINLSLPGMLHALVLRSTAPHARIVSIDTEAAKAVPVIGAAGGGIVNVLFIHHFQDMARGHFVVKRLEARYGIDKVRRVYEDLDV